MALSTSAALTASITIMAGGAGVAIHIGGITLGSGRPFITSDPFGTRVPGDVHKTAPGAVRVFKPDTVSSPLMLRGLSSRINGKLIVI